MAVLARERSCQMLAWSFYLAYQRFLRRQTTVAFGPLVRLAVFDALVATDREDEFAQAVIADIERDQRE